MRLLGVVIAASMATACGGDGLVTIGPAPDGGHRGKIDGGDAGAHMDVRAMDVPEDMFHPHESGPMDTGAKDTGPKDTGPNDTGPKDTGPNDTGPKDTGPEDTGPKDTGPAPCPTPPDCSNPMCKAEGYVCTPPAPFGWGIVTVDSKPGAPCPAGYGPSFTVVTAPTGGPAVCGCSCSLGSLPSCVEGELDYEINLTGLTTCSLGELFSVNGACNNGTYSLANYHQVLSTPGPTGGTCNATATTSVPATGSTTDYVCPLSGTPSTTGCSGGDVCVATTSAQTQCLIQPGASLTCPAGYPVAHEVGASVTDTRACGTCACNPPTATCVDPSLIFYTGADCTGTMTSINMDGSCDATSPVSPDSYLSVQYTANPSGTTCGTGTTPPSTGSLTLSSPETLCCTGP